MTAFRLHVEPDAGRGSRSALRQAALTLHGMSPEDRSWVMARVSASERAVLQPLLSELTAIAFPCDGSLVQEALRLARPAQQPVGESSGARSQARLERMAPSLIHAALRHEPDALIARLLSIRAWPWEHELMRSLGGSRRLAIQRVKEHMRQPQHKDAEELAAALIDAMLAATTQASEERPPRPPAPPRMTRALFDRVRRCVARLHLQSGRPIASDAELGR